MGTIYNTRVTYRVKKISTKWDPNKKIESRELIPLNYSLYEFKTEKPLYYGIKYTIELRISAETKRSCLQELINPLPEDKWYEITQYYITNEVIMKRILDIIYKNSSVGSKNVLNWIHENGGKITWNLIIKAIEKFGSKNVANLLDKYTLLFTTFGTLTEAILEDLKQSDLEKLFEMANLMDSNNNTLVINYCKYVSHINNYNRDSASFNLPIITVDISSITNLRYVSCKYDSNRSKELGFHRYYPEELDYYGTISYITTEDELDNIIDELCKQYDLFDWMGWLPN